jgi:hypothetical protein
MNSKKQDVRRAAPICGSFQRCLGLAVGRRGFERRLRLAAQAADTKGPQISRSIAKEMIAAQKALQGNQFDEGLKTPGRGRSGLAADAVRSQDDRRTQGLCLHQDEQLKAAQVAYEEAIGTGAATAEETTRYTRAAFQISYSSQQYAKAIEYGKKLVDSEAANADTYAIITQSYYLQKDCKNAVVWSDKSIAFARKSGETPKENLYLFKLQCAFDNNDTPATIARSRI